MPIPLLSTKFYVPPPRADVVARPRLAERLLDGIGRSCCFTLLSGPAGSGKTTLLAQLVARLPGPVAWLSLDETDNDPARFWSYLLTTCRRALPDVGAAALELLEEARPLADETLPTLLLNDLAVEEQRLLLILDDFHVVDNPAIHAGITFLLDHLPDNAHLIFSTRVDPPWPLGRYRVRNQLVEIRARDLRFTLEETTAFFLRTMALELPGEAVAALAARTEGWVAGLQLAAIALRSRPAPPGESPPDPGSFVEAFTGSHRYVAEYLVEEVLRQQPEEVRGFLLQTSILDRLNAPLGAAVAGRADGQEILSQLRRANLFLIPLDAQGEWFRYHHLFADLLRARLAHTETAETVARLHLRAATWYEQQQLIGEAIAHALAAADFARVARLIEREARAMMFGGRAATLRRWLEALPDVILQTHPRLAIYQLWLDLMQERVDLSPETLREKEALLYALPQTPENERLRLELMVVLGRFVAFSGNTARAIRLAEEALERLPASAPALRARANSTLAVAHGMEGNAEKSRQAFERCLGQARASGNYSLAAHATMMRAVELADYGQLPAAARAYRSIVEMEAKAGQAVFFPAGLGYIGLAEIHLEWNERDRAETYLQQGMELCRRGGLSGLSIGHVLKARWHQAQGDFEAALAELEKQGQTGVDPRGTAREIIVCLEMGEIDVAWRRARPWLDMLAGPPGSAPLLIREIVDLTLARLFLARGEPAQAERLLARVEETAGPAERKGRLIELYLLRALLYREREQPAAAVEALEQALALARPAGYRLLFLEQVSALIPLLRAVAGRHGTGDSAGAYAGELLEAAGALASPAPGGAGALVEPLTPREMEVLVRIAAGDSNQAIAEKLFITVRTVKKHAGNIYGKLNVANRTQAAARARELGLLSGDE